MPNKHVLIIVKIIKFLLFIYLGIILSFVNKTNILMQQYFIIAFNNTSFIIKSLFILII